MLCMDIAQQWIGFTYVELFPFESLPSSFTFFSLSATYWVLSKTNLSGLHLRASLPSDFQVSFPSRTVCRWQEREEENWDSYSYNSLCARLPCVGKPNFIFPDSCNFSLHRTELLTDLCFSYFLNSFSNARCVKGPRES